MCAYVRARARVCIYRAAAAINGVMPFLFAPNTFDPPRPFELPPPPPLLVEQATNQRTQSSCPAAAACRRGVSPFLFCMAQWAPASRSNVKIAVLPVYVVWGFVYGSSRVYTCMHVCMHVCMYVYMYERMHAYMHASAPVCMYVCGYVGR